MCIKSMWLYPFHNAAANANALIKTQAGFHKTIIRSIITHILTLSLDLNSDNHKINHPFQKILIVRNQMTIPMTHFMLAYTNTFCCKLLKKK